MEYKLQDLVDIEHFQDLQDRLNEIYSFPSSIIDNDGNILTATAWQDICTQFHRKNRDAEKICIKSDQYIKDHIHEANPTLSYPCPHGLVDNATPIIIDGIHLGNFFTGQFFLEEPNMEFFRSQAQKYGFDEEAYLAAVRKVPIWNQEQLTSYLHFIQGLIAVISESGLKNLREIETRKQIQKSEKRYRSILKAAIDGYWLTDTDGQLLEVNDAYCRMSGYSEDELLAMRISDLEAAETPELVAEHMKKIILTGSGLFETKHRRKDGTNFDIEVSIQFHPEEGGQCVCFLRDITERKQAENALRESEKTFQIAMAATKDGLYDWDLVANKIYYSPGWKRIVGYEDDELPNDFTVWENLTKAEDVERSWKMQNELIHKQRDRFEIEFQMKHKDGHWVDILSRAKALFDKNGKAVRIVGTHVDISERKIFERALAEEKELFKAVFEQAGGYCMLLQPTDNGIPTILDANQAACKTHGYTRKEMIGRPVADLDDDEGKRLCRERTKTILSGKTLNIENNHVRKDGSIFPVEVFASIVRFKNKAPVIVTTEFDITERRKAEDQKVHLERQLLQAQKLESIGNLAGGIAHDFNNILSSIIGFTEIALDDAPQNASLEDSLQEVYSAGKRARDLVKQILAFARQSDEKRNPIQPRVIINEVLKFIRSTIPTTIEIKQDVGSDSFIMGNATQIHQVVMNLCTNAAQAMEDSGGILKVSLKDVVFKKKDLLIGMRRGTYIEIKVSDTGVGIAPELIESIFDPYFTTKAPGEGTGMGLAMAHGIVESYDGKITVDSQLGKGTTFTIYLPVSKKRSDLDAYVPEQLPTGTERILFVDDEYPIAKMGSQILERLGYLVTTRTDSIEALELFHTKPNYFDLVVTDMTMANLTGDKLAVELIKIRRDIPVILCTGYSKKISDETASEIGIKAFAYKPMVKADLAKTVRKVLDEAKS